MYNFNPDQLCMKRVMNTKNIRPGPQPFHQKSNNMTFLISHETFPGQTCVHNEDKNSEKKMRLIKLYL